MTADVQHRAAIGVQNLKDLVSGPGVDKELSVPLSVADLHTCLDRIKLQSEGVKDRVYHTVSAHYRSFLEIITNASDTCHDVSLIFSELHAALNLLEGQANGNSGEIQVEESESGIRNGRPKGLNGADLAVCRAAEEARKLEGAIRDRAGAKSIIASVIQVQALLAEGDSWLAVGDYLRAAKRLSHLKEQLFSYEEEEGAAPLPIILQWLQQAWQSRYEKLKSQLEWLSTQAIGLDPKQFQLRVTAQLPAGTSRAGSGFASTSATTLPQIFEAMEALGILELRLAKLSDAIFSCILNPLLRDPSLGVEEGESADERQVAGIRAVSTGGNKEMATPELLYPKLLQVARFLLRHVAGGDVRRMSGIGRTLWPRLADGIIATCLSKAIPNQTSQLVQFRAVADLTLQTEEALKALALIPPRIALPEAQAADGMGDRLTTFAANVEIHFAAKRRSSVLGAARQLIVAMDFTSLQVGTDPDSDASRGEGEEDGEEGPVFLFESCHVTQAAQGLLHLVHAALQEACLSTPRPATALYVATREALSLYRAMLPALWGLSTDPVRGLLHSNDCLFIAHHLLTLGLQYRAVLEKQLGAAPVFVDLVPLFRRMAEEGCNGVLRHQHLLIKEALRKGGEFVNTDDSTRYREAYAALKEAMDHLEAAAILWQPLAGGRRLCQLVAHMAEAVLQHVVGKVVAIQDLAATETQALQQLLREVLARLQPLLPPSALELLVPCYRKAGRVADVLDMSLLAITQAWQSGDLAACGFSRQEVASLVEAIFRETQQRRECLQRIAISL